MAAMFIMVALLLLLVEAASTEMPLSDMAGEREARDREESSGGMEVAPAREEATDARLVRFSRFPFRADRGLTLMLGSRADRNSDSVTRATSSSGVRIPAAVNWLKAASFSKEEWTEDNRSSDGACTVEKRPCRVLANAGQNQSNNVR